MRKMEKNKKFISESFSFLDLGSAKYADCVFINCDFTNTILCNSSWDNCLFVSCNFSLANFGASQFDRCKFKQCEFVGVFFDSSSFKNCHAYLSTFETARFGSVKFDFLSTDKCDFSRIKIESTEGLPGECREIVGEVVRQCSEDPQIIALSGLIKNHREFCWETMIGMARSFLSNENREKVFASVRKFPNLGKLLNRYDLQLVKKENLWPLEQ